MEIKNSPLLQFQHKAKVEMNKHYFKNKKQFFCNKFYNQSKSSIFWILGNKSAFNTILRRLLSPFFNLSQMTVNSAERNKNN